MSMNENDFDKIYCDALRILDFSPQTSKKLKLKLLRKGHDEELVDEVIKKLNTSGLLNDKQNAMIFAENLMKNKGESLRNTVRKLVLKGIPFTQANEVALKCMEECGGESEILLKYIKRSAKPLARAFEKGGLAGVKTKLLSAGFTYRAINDNLSDIRKIFPRRKET